MERLSLDSVFQLTGSGVLAVVDDELCEAEAEKPKMQKSCDDLDDLEDADGEDTEPSVNTCIMAKTFLTRE